MINISLIESMISARFDNRVVRAIAEQLKPLEFYEMAESLSVDQRKKVAGITFQTEGDEKQSTIGHDRAFEILKRIGSSERKYDLQTVLLNDIPYVKVIYKQKNEEGEMVEFEKMMENLSVGQKQTILLSIVLLSESNIPLIIDQPEDNLDSEFIFKSIVKILRGIKEQRQVILVTHNANLAVLGDSELITPLVGTANHGVISDAGSVDNKKTQAKVIDILEGGRDAFEKRYEMYFQKRS